MEYVSGGEVSELLLHFILRHVLDLYVKNWFDNTPASTPSFGQKNKMKFIIILINQLIKQKIILNFPLVVVCLYFT